MDNQGECVVMVDKPCCSKTNKFSDYSNTTDIDTNLECGQANLSDYETDFIDGFAFFSFDDQPKMIKSYNRQTCPAVDKTVASASSCLAPKNPDPPPIIKNRRRTQPDSKVRKHKRPIVKSVNDQNQSISSDSSSTMNNSCPDLDQFSASHLNESLNSSSETIGTIEKAVLKDQNTTNLNVEVNETDSSNPINITRTIVTQVDQQDRQNCKTPSMVVKQEEGTTSSMSNLENVERSRSNGELNGTAKTTAIPPNHESTNPVDLNPILPRALVQNGIAPMFDATALLKSLKRPINENTTQMINGRVNLVDQVQTVIDGFMHCNGERTHDEYTVARKMLRMEDTAAKGNSEITSSDPSPSHGFNGSLASGRPHPVLLNRSLAHHNNTSKSDQSSSRSSHDSSSFLHASVISPKKEVFSSTPEALIPPRAPFLTGPPLPLFNSSSTPFSSIGQHMPGIASSSSQLQQQFFENFLQKSSAGLVVDRRPLSPQNFTQPPVAGRFQPNPFLTGVHTNGMMLPFANGLSRLPQPPSMTPVLDGHSSGLAFNGSQLNQTANPMIPFRRKGRWCALHVQIAWDILNKSKQKKDAQQQPIPNNGQPMHILTNSVRSNERVPHSSSHRPGPGVGAAQPELTKLEATKSHQASESKSSHHHHHHHHGNHKAHPHQKQSQQHCQPNIGTKDPIANTSHGEKIPGLTPTTSYGKDRETKQSDAMSHKHFVPNGLLDHHNKMTPKSSHHSIHNLSNNNAVVTSNINFTNHFAPPTNHQSLQSTSHQIPGLNPYQRATNGALLPNGNALSASQQQRTPNNPYLPSPKNNTNDPMALYSAALGVGNNFPGQYGFGGQTGVDPLTASLLQSQMGLLQQQSSLVDLVRMRGSNPFLSLERPPNHNGTHNIPPVQVGGATNSMPGLEAFYASLFQQRDLLMEQQQRLLNSFNTNNNTNSFGASPNFLAPSFGSGAAASDLLARLVAAQQNPTVGQAATGLLDPSTREALTRLAMMGYTSSMEAGGQQGVLTAPSAKLQSPFGAATQLQQQIAMAARDAAANLPGAPNR